MTMTEVKPEKHHVAPPGDFDLEAMIAQVQKRILHEARRMLRRLLLALAETALLAIVSLIVLIAGIWRLGDALSMLVAEWVGSPGTGEAITGLAMIALALGGLYWLRKPLAL